jgi:hypothetical protein
MNDTQLNTLNEVRPRDSTMGRPRSDAGSRSPLSSVTAGLWLSSGYVDVTTHESRVGVTRPACGRIAAMKVAGSGGSPIDAASSSLKVCTSVS